MMCLLQISTTITMLYYNMIAVYLKTTKFQLLTRRYFPGLVLGLLLLEVVLVLSPVLGVRAGLTEQSCVFVSGEMETRARDGWLYTVLFPYFLPLVAAVGPFIYLAIRLKEGHIIEPQRSQVLVTMAVVGGYFVFHLLYFILMTARQVEFLVDMSQMSRMLGEVTHHYDGTEITVFLVRSQRDVHHPPPVCPDRSRVAHCGAPGGSGAGQGAPHPVAWLRADQGPDPGG